MTFALPKLPEPSASMSLVQLAERTYRFAAAVHDFLRQLPTIEFKTIRADGGDYPLTVETITRRPIGVVCLRAYTASDPSLTISDTSIAWYPSDDPAAPGIMIDELGAAPGDVAGDEIECVLLVLGERD